MTSPTNLLELVRDAMKLADGIQDERRRAHAILWIGAAGIGAGILKICVDIWLQNTGQRPQPAPEDPRAVAAAILGVAPGADELAIRRAHRKRMREVHPDLHGATTTEVAREVNAARDLLLARLPQ